MRHLIIVNIILFCLSGLIAQTFKPCVGVYRIPYANGTNVHVSNNHQVHSPLNRIDMHGHDGGAYTIVAAASGWIRFIVDNNTDSQGSCSNNNYVWIQHQNGEWTKYSHMATNSVANLGHSVNDWVVSGEALGIESDIGCTSGPHLHFEVAVPDDLSNPIVAAGGFVIGENRMPIICGITRNVFDANQFYTASNCVSDCQSDIVMLGGTVVAQNYDVRMADVSISTVSGNALEFQNASTGAYKAGERIIFKPGFHAKSGTAFYAMIRDCNQ